jgi:hypothetical protein
LSTEKHFRNAGQRLLPDVPSIFMQTADTRILVGVSQGYSVYACNNAALPVGIVTLL